MREKGFTLIELVIAMVIVAILAAIAYPSYRQHVLRSNRTEGMALLHEAAAREERYLAQNNSYADTVAKLNLSATSANGLYVLAVTADSSTFTYDLTATPQGSQTQDSCGTLTLDETGVRGAAGKTEPDSTGTVKNCWR